MLNKGLLKQLTTNGKLYVEHINTERTQGGMYYPCTLYYSRKLNFDKPFEDRFRYQFRFCK
jgi:hypothetical protein